MLAVLTGLIAPVDFLPGAVVVFFPAATVQLLEDHEHNVISDNDRQQSEYNIIKREQFHKSGTSRVNKHDYSSDLRGASSLNFKNCCRFHIF
jgi:hypothetical protein